jgi:hypothetical protein
MKPKKKPSILMAMLIVLLIVLGVPGAIVFILNTAATPTNSFRPLPSQEGAIDLLFTARGGFGFDAFAEGVFIRIAHYQNGERILHEPVAAVASMEARQFSGSLSWGVTSEEGLPNELRAIVTRNGARSTGHFDFSQFGFTPNLILGDLIDMDGPIEQGRQYALQIWQSSNTVRHDYSGGIDLQALIEDNEEIVILYVMFE